MSRNPTGYTRWRIYSHGSLNDPSPGQEGLQGARRVLLLAGDTLPLLLLHLGDARGEGVEVVKHRLHGDGNLVLLLPGGPEHGKTTGSQSGWRVVN